MPQAPSQKPKSNGAAGSPPETGKKKKKTPPSEGKSGLTTADSTVKSSDTAVDEAVQAESRVERPVVNPDVKSFKKWGNDPMTAAYAMQCLGWQAESDNGKSFGVRYLFKDLHGVKIRCYHNDTNRPLTWMNVEMLMQEILRRRWSGPNGNGKTINGETIIIGKTGRILNGQHTLIALVLARQEWLRNRDKWEEFWPTEPVMDKLVVVGIDEDDDTVNTMDTARPRSLADVLYRSEYFAAKSPNVRLRVSRALQFSVKLLWDRTGAKYDGYTPLRTISESVGFLNRHPSVVRAVEHIHELDARDKRVARYITVGYASALMYLQAAAMSDPDKYAGVTMPSEQELDLGLWDVACEFWGLIAERHAGVKYLVEAVGRAIEAGHTAPPVKMALIIKAWNLFSNDQPITAKGLELEFKPNEYGVPVLQEFPTVGGIDVSRSDLTGSVKSS